MKPILIFDYDGTLHETMKIYAPAVYDTVRWLNTSCGVSVEVPEPARIQSWLGMNTADMWKDFMPELDPSLKRRAALRIGEGMQEGLAAGVARWYDGTAEMLDQLKSQGFTMAVLSNCGISYARMHWERFGMDRWFTAFFPCECWDNAPKQVIMTDIARDFFAAVEKTPVRREMAGSGPAHSETVEIGYGDRRDGSRVDNRDGRQDISRDGGSRFVVIGDRSSDFEGARAVDALFIGCRYGYGTRDELAGADAEADCPADIAKILIESPGISSL
jgi:phosphoglycolate phosphatase